MTSPTYHADDDQLAGEHDRAVPQNTLTQPDTDLPLADPELARAEAGQTMPGTDPMAPDSGLAAHGAGQTVHEDPASQPAAAAALADDGAPAPILPDYPGFTANGDGGDGDRDGDGPEQPGTADSSPMNPALVSPALTVPESVTGSRPAGNAASAGGPWNEIQAMFVDDPAASIERAAGLVNDRVEALIQSVRERQRSVQAASQADDAGTEELRVALQHYRTFWNSLEDLSAQD